MNKLSQLEQVDGSYVPEVTILERSTLTNITKGQEQKKKQLEANCLEQFEAWAYLDSCWPLLLETLTVFNMRILTI